MNHRHDKPLNNRGKKKSKLRCFCVIPLIGITLFCVISLGNTTLVEHKADTPQNISNISSTPQSISDIPSMPQGVSDISSGSNNQNKIDNQQLQVNTANTNQWELLLVNPWGKLSDGFSVELTNLKNGHAIDKRAYPDLQAMMDDARAAGLSPIICSSYRTQEKQQSLFDKQVRKYVAQGYSQEKAAEEAAKWVAIPGTSEHQTGLAVDIVALSYQLLDKKQADTAELKWLMENAYKYGFILRYPADKTEITGINYEPWHYRYVGKKAAQEIYEQGVCLEEYLCEDNFT